MVVHSRVRFGTYIHRIFISSIPVSDYLLIGSPPSVRCLTYCGFGRLGCGHHPPYTERQRNLGTTYICRHSNLKLRYLCSVRSTTSESPISLSSVARRIMAVHRVFTLNMLPEFSVFHVPIPQLPSQALRLAIYHITGP
jgi:hypothetical protein